MAPAYAGILGLLAFATCIGRALVHGGEPNSTLVRATIQLVVFAIIGYIAGRLAEATVVESVQKQMSAPATGQKSNA